MSREPSRRRVLLGAAAAVVLGVALFGAWLVHDGAGGTDRSVARARRRANLSWKRDDRCAFKITVDARITLNPDTPVPQEINLQLRGLLCARVLESKAGAAKVAMQLRNISRRVGPTHDADRLTALGVPFIVQFEGGIPSAMQFPAGLDAQVRTELAEIVRTFQATLPESAALKWSGLERHERGQYRAAYAVLSTGLSTGLSAGSWSKRKVSYIPGTPGALGPEEVRVLNSSGTLTPAATTSWWERAEVTDEIRVLVVGSAIAQAKTLSVLEAVADGFDPTCDLARLDNAAAVLAMRAPRYRSPVASDAEVTPRTAGPEDRKRFLQVLSNIRALKSKKHDYMWALVELLKEFPEFAAEIPPVMARTDTAERAGARLLHALQLVGTEACQDALREVSLGLDYPHDNRLRGVIAMGGLENANPASVTTLWELSESNGTADQESIGHTALLALGNIGGLLRKNDGDRYADLSQRLQTRLGVVSGPSKAVVLTAMANTGDPEMFAAAASEIQSSRSIVRAAAVDAVAATNHPDSLETLYARLQVEKDSWIRRKLIAGMARLSKKNDATFAGCLVLLKTEEDKEVQMGLVRYLGDNLKRYPASRPTLKTMSRDKKYDADIRKYLTGKLRTKSAIQLRPER